MSVVLSRGLTGYARACVRCAKQVGGGERSMVETFLDEQRLPASTASTAVSCRLVNSKPVSQPETFRATG